MLRWSTSYCSFTSDVNAFSVIAMNGSSYGTSNTGKPSAARLLEQRLRDRVVVEPGAEAEPGDVVRRQPLDQLRAAPPACRAACPS